MYVISILWCRLLQYTFCKSNLNLGLIAAIIIVKPSTRTIEEEQKMWKP